MMNKLWSDRAWDDYLYWQMQDKKLDGEYPAVPDWGRAAEKVMAGKGKTCVRK